MAAKALSTEPTQANFARVTAMLAEAPGRLVRFGAGRSDEQLGRAFYGQAIYPYRRDRRSGYGLRLPGTPGRIEWWC